MNPTLAVHLPPHQLPELQRAARALLRRPLITAAQPDELRLALKWETVLRNEFGQKLGYRLDVSRSAARLLRRPAALTPTRGARLGTGRHLTRWGYVYLCLTLAALEHPGHQVLASELLTRISQLARGDDRLQLDSTEFVQRRAFRDAVRYLEELGVLAVRDGDVDALLNDGQVLWDIPIKVVAERLGHAHPAFTMHTYQHVLPGMSAAAAERVATLMADATR